MNVPTTHAQFAAQTEKPTPIFANSIEKNADQMDSSVLHQKENATLKQGNYQHKKH